MSILDRLANRMGYMPKREASPVASSPVEKKSSVAGFLQHEYGYDYTVNADGKEMPRKDAAHYFRTNPWVYAAVNTICKTVAHVPFKVYRGEGEDAVTDTAILDFMRKPAPMVGFTAFVESIMQNLELNGTAYVEWVRDVSGPEAYVLRSSNMAPEFVSRDVRRYKYSVNGKTKIFQPDELAIGMYQNPCDDLDGLSPLEVCISMLETWEAAENYNKNFLMNGGRPSGVFTTEQPLGEAEIKQYTAEINRLIRGPKNAGRYSVFGHGLEFQELSQTPKDADYTGLLKWCRETLLAAMNMPPVEVGVFEYANYANSMVQKRIYWEECIIPRLAVVRDLLTQTVHYLFGDGLQVREDLTGIKALQENAAEQATVDNVRIGNGTLTVNESRTRQGLDPVEGGDVPMVGGGLVPLADAVMPAESNPQDMELDNVSQFATAASAQKG